MIIPLNAIRGQASCCTHHASCDGTFNRQYVATPGMHSAKQSHTTLRAAQQAKHMPYVLVNKDAHARACKQCPCPGMKAKIVPDQTQLVHTALQQCFALHNRPMSKGNNDAAHRRTSCRASSANLEHGYAFQKGMARVPAADPMLIMRPGFPARSKGRSALVMRSAPMKLTSMI